MRRASTHRLTPKRAMINKAAPGRSLNGALLCAARNSSYLTVSYEHSFCARVPPLLGSEVLRDDWGGTEHAVKVPINAYYP